MEAPSSEDLWDFSFKFSDPFLQLANFQTPGVVSPYSTFPYDVEDLSIATSLHLNARISCTPSSPTNLKMATKNGINGASAGTCGALPYRVCAPAIDLEFLNPSFQWHDEILRRLWGLERSPCAERKYKIRATSGCEEYYDHRWCWIYVRILVP